VRTLTKSFVLVAAYLVAIAAVYWLLTTERAGTLLLLGTAVMLGLIAGYLVRRDGVVREPLAPEDDPEADPRDAAGTPVGSFPFSSAWPIVLAGGVVLAAFGVLYTVILLPMGIALVGLAVLGLMRESRA
jgi:hypothetical protein